MIEPFVEHEVDVAVFRVAEDDRVLVSVLLEQPSELLARLVETLNGNGDVFEQCGRA